MWEKATFGSIAAALACAVLATTPAYASSTARVRAENTARATVTQYRTAAAAAGPIDCLGPAGNAEPGTNEWRQRDLVNQYCATERLQDELASPAFATTFWSETPGIYANQNLAMLMDPAHPHLTLGQLVPGGSTTDPYRTVDRW